MGGGGVAGAAAWVAAATGDGHAIRASEGAVQQESQQHHATETVENGAVQQESQKHHATETVENGAVKHEPAAPETIHNGDDRARPQRDTTQHAQHPSETIQPRHSSATIQYACHPRTCHHRETQPNTRATLARATAQAGA